MSTSRSATGMLVSAPRLTSSSAKSSPPFSSAPSARATLAATNNLDGADFLQGILGIHGDDHAVFHQQDIAALQRLGGGGIGRTG